MNEALELERINGSQTTAGTTLLSEVEEQRMAAERRTISMKVQFFWNSCVCLEKASDNILPFIWSLTLSCQVKYDAMRKAHDMALHQRQQMRNQIQMLMQMGGSKADEEEVRRLNQALSQTRSELTQVGTKLINVERQYAERFDQLRAHHEAFSEFGTKATYVQFLHDGRYFSHPGHLCGGHTLASTADWTKHYATLRTVFSSWC